MTGFASEVSEGVLCLCSHLEIVLVVIRHFIDVYAKVSKLVTKGTGEVGQMSSLLGESVKTAFF